MISPRFTNALLVLLLAVSLSLKVPGSLSREAMSSRDVTDGLAAILKGNGFEVGLGASDEDLFLVSATKGECRLLVALLSPHGWHRHVIRQLAQDGSQLVFHYDGMSYDEQPMLLTRFHDYRDRLLRFAGGSPPARPVLGIVGSPGCELDAVPWSTLGVGHNLSRSDAGRS
jgi:hypothetical protein